MSRYVSRARPLYDPAVEAPEPSEELLAIEDRIHQHEAEQKEV